MFLLHVRVPGFTSAPHPSSLPMHTSAVSSQEPGAHRETWTDLLALASAHFQSISAFCVSSEVGTGGCGILI